MPDADDNLVDDLAEEFARRWRAGEGPSVEEYAGRYPQWADEIRAVFGAVLMMEQLKPRREDTAAAAPAGALPPERVGDYRIVREIGRGGMGVVYEAVQESLGRHVALKVLPAHLLANEKLRSRFRREAQAAARLHHTNIVPVFGFGEEAGLCFYVMQLIPGRGLDQVIRSAAAARDGAAADSAATTAWGPEPRGDTGLGPANEAVAGPAPGARAAAEIGLQVAEALAHAHSQGVLHRDIKPSNLLLDDRGAVWVTDFGVARLVEEANLTQSGDLVGTLRYMPPERFDGRSDARSDVYSLGLTLYELLALRPAFPDTTPQRLIQLITGADPPRLKDGVPADLETVVLKAAAREPDHRYQTAGELADDLRRFLDDRPILARRAGPLERAWRWCRRNPALAAAAAAVFALMVAVTVVSVAASVRTAAANRETTDALAAEQAQREHAETTSALALDALNRMYDRFAPARLVVTPPPTDEEGEGAELPPQPVLSPEAVPLLEESLRTYEQIARSSRAFPKLQAQAAEANHRIGDLRQRLGRFEEAVPAYRAAIELYAGLPADTGAARIRLARSYNELGRALRSLQQFAEARQAHLQAVEVLQGAPRAQADRPEHRYELARTYFTLGQRELLLPLAGGPRGPGRGPPETAPVRRAIELLEQLVREHGSVPEYRHLLACCYRDAGPEPPGRGPRTGAAGDRAVELLRQLVVDFPRVPDYRFDLCETLGQLTPPGRPRGTGVATRARERLQEAITLSAELAVQYPNVPQYTAAQAQYHDRLGMVLLEARDLDGAEKAHQKAVSLQAGLVKHYPEAVTYRFWLSLMERSLARVLSARGELTEARARLESAATRLDALRRNDPALAPAAGFLGMTYRELAQVLTRQGQTAEAARIQRKADEIPRERGPSRGGPPFGRDRR